MLSRWSKLLAITGLLLFSLLSFTGQADAASSTYVTKGNTTSKVVALTFDDGSDGTNINKILGTLKTNNVKATFFLTGSGINHHPSWIRNIANAGHQVGNHSYSHPDFTKISIAAMQSELARTETAYKNVTGKSTKPIFRAPFGASNATVLKGVGDAGYTHTIQWNIDTIDWRGLSSTEITNKVVNNIVPGSIVLMHTGAGASGTPGALPGMISKLKAKGYKFVTVSELLKLPPTGGATYTAKAGDTLYSIARKYNVTVAALAKANNITNYNLIRVGQVLVIPGTTAPTPPPATSVKYTVKAGDTLYSIASKYNTTVAAIASANKITNTNLISVGQVLIIPVKQAPPPVMTVKYTVKAGDTLYSIARKYNTTVTAIAKANNITNVNSIRVGQALIIPR
ncbi:MULTISPECIES: LysM peptidoglycan-binding domain-containing protein [unclassified Planococcus (in: firmicutes)]|uniref:LysM peptidoglycan-binding domain-containing protein n=1 Tax=unclassified Planococcus (in: firmicutes) TaxID=2662419 RepID=UPI000C328EE6|nr:MULTISPECIES: LysM peptidoglycan-binding domain-containing protein [unclassified Planococcus (in: firmicutes)]AUD14380.1 polysaccharide deacetylase [Planococcus sp. MB-3u-03]PKG46681.1 polysaccharide deacetylase [Planococcus sp. Urea-trap-24]PKG89466.1 polysaccharide deacetylase [Planococcus sp. Urea-3u-39]PKH39244.1 polysaccharide deacetylase [Planococcus sp. MB-3u-09]